MIDKSPAFGFPPLVSRRGVDRQIVARMSRVLMRMSEDPKGRTFLEGLKLDGFGESESELFDSIRRMAGDTRRALLKLASGNNE